MTWAEMSQDGAHDGPLRWQ